MRHTFWEDKQVTIMWFFSTEQFWAHWEIYVCPKTKSMVSFFFAHLKKKQNKATTQCCEKLAIWFSIDSKFPANRTPPRSLPRIEGGGRGSQKGEGGTISKHLFLGCISFQTYQRKSFRSLCNSHCHASESRPPSIIKGDL